MFAYYLDLALRSLKRNKVLTLLMVLALALGIGATITTLTVLRLDEKSGQYVESVVVPAGEAWKTDDPYPISLDPAAFV